MHRRHALIRVVGLIRVRPSSEQWEWIKVRLTHRCAGKVAGRVDVARAYILDNKDNQIVRLGIKSAHTVNRQRESWVGGYGTDYKDSKCA